MLYRFKSQADADVVMLKINAEQLLAIIGKAAGAQGIVTVAQMPGAIAALKSAVASERAAGKSASADAESTHEGDEAQAGDGVALHQRAAPFIHLLEVSLAEGKDVVWGV